MEVAVRKIGLRSNRNMHNQITQTVVYADDKNILARTKYNSTEAMNKLEKLEFKD